MTNNANQNEKQLSRKSLLIVFLKYGFAVLVTILAAYATFSRRYLAVGILELSLIFTISNVLLKRVPILGHVVHFLLLFIYEAQMLVLYFGSSYISLLMVTNLVSLEDLSGNFAIYLVFLIPMVVTLLLPMPALRLGKLWRWAAVGAFGLWICMLVIFGFRTSPVISAGCLVKDAIDYQKMRNTISGPVEADVMQYYKSEVADYRTKPDALPEKPNIVLIFVEGLSQSVVEDERNLMPNLAALEKKSLFFDEYYNHTFATYRGLISQLYSGYQFSDRDGNQLISLHSLLHNLGYYTTFINTEPKNGAFTEYLEMMGFDNFVSNIDDVTRAYTTLSYITDKNAFEQLFDTMVAQHQSSQPFFTAMYSLGTHVSFDSPDEVFGDGSNPELNKFYNVDVQLGRFMERFEASELAEDTLVVITSDHATYRDKAFSESFPDYYRWHSEIDRIPLIFYYRGIEPEVFDAGGRNSIDLAPTILDYNDLSGPNAFLGESLFHAEGMQGEILPYDRCFFNGTQVTKTGVKEDEDISKEEKRLMRDKLMEYFSVSIPSDQSQRTYAVDVKVSEDGERLLVSTGFSVKSGQYLWLIFKSGSEWEGYRAELSDDGIWRCEIPFEKGKTGIFTIKGRVGEADVMPEGHQVFVELFYVGK